MRARDDYHKCGRRVLHTVLTRAPLQCKCSHKEIVTTFCINQPYGAKVEVIELGLFVQGQRSHLR